MSWVIEHSPHGGSELLVLLMVANHADADGAGAYPSAARLAVKCRMSERQVVRILHRLKAAGAIRVEDGTGRGHTNRLTVVMGKPDNLSPITGKPDNLSPFEPIKADIAMSPISEERVTSRAIKADIAMSPEPSLEPSLLLTPAAEALDAVLGAFTARGYTTDARFLSVLGRTYPDLNLELEALKLAEWLTEPRNRNRECSRKFIDNWLKKAEADRREREQLTLRALGPAAPRVNGGAVVNGTYHPPAAFQRNPNPEADLPEWDEERAERSAAEKARVKQLLLTHRRHTA